MKNIQVKLIDKYILYDILLDVKTKILLEFIHNKGVVCNGRIQLFLLPRQLFVLQQKSCM